ncbi:MAG: hypothetical protein HYY13_05830 [Nitrospirae bacterium]|nr:hypothetical protein [Nitrospirota bacterium]
MRRREFLTSSLAAIATSFTAPSLGGVACAASPPGRGNTFSPSHLHTLRAAAEAVLPNGSEWPTLDAIPVVERIDKHLGKMGVAYPKVVQDFGSLLGLVEWWPWLASFRFSRFSALPLETRRKELEGWGRSRWGWRRLGFYALKSASAFFYFGDPRVFTLVPYDGTWKDKYGIPPEEIPGLVETAYAEPPSQ